MPRTIPATDDSPRESRETLSSRAYQELEELIITLRLPPGTVWTEAALYARLGLGRTPVREALQRLALENLVSIIPSHGIRISELSIENQLMVCELRRELDRLISRRAARMAKRDERDRISRYAIDIVRIATEGDTLNYLRFHRTVRHFVAACARNWYAARAIAEIESHVRRFFFAYQTEWNSLLHGARLHATILDAIARGDEDAAALASDQRMDDFDAFNQRVLGLRR